MNVENTSLKDDSLARHDWTPTFSDPQLRCIRRKRNAYITTCLESIVRGTFGEIRGELVLYRTDLLHPGAVVVDKPYEDKLPRTHHIKAATMLQEMHAAMDRT